MASLIARSDAGSMAINREIMDLGDIVAAAQGTIAPLAVNARVALKTGDVLVQVIDDGIGIAEENQERIFERFFQVDSSVARLYNGSGLGLALVREYAVAQGFGISVSSALGEGSTFTLRIPAAAAVDFGEEE